MLLVFLLVTKFVLLTSNTTTCEGSANGADCVFPFTYYGVKFYECTHFNLHRPWCSTEAEYISKWGFCDCDNVKFVGFIKTPSPTSSANDVTTPTSHYAFSQGALNNGVIETLVIPILFNDRISDLGYINYTKEKEDYVSDSISLFYRDQSFGKLDYKFTWTNDYVSCMNSSTTSLGQVQVEAYRLAEKDGLIWCNGICGRTDGLFDNLRRKNGYHFDQIIYSVLGPYAFDGLGSIGHPNVWSYAGGSTGPGILEHELGHNLGLNHQYTTKYDRIVNNLYKYDYTIGITYDRESRMGAGGAVYSNDEKSRFYKNGHFSPCAKDYHGWLDDNNNNIIDITLDNVEDMDTSIIMNYTLYAYDRPDITLTNDKTFLIRISYGSEYEYYSSIYLNNIYIYYRASYGTDDVGISIQYCMLKINRGSEAGAQIQTFTYDIHGDTYIQTDHYLYINETYVLQPFIYSIENSGFVKFTNPYSNNKYKLKIAVLDQINPWIRANCNYTDYTCENELNYDIQIQYFSDENETKINNDENILPIDYEISCKKNTQLNINLTNKQYTLLHISDNETGIYGRGHTKFSICPNNAHVMAYIFDKRPYSIPPTLGSTMAIPFRGNVNDCIDGSVCGIKSIQILQNEASSLHIAEIEIYEEINGINIAVNNDNINCYTIPFYENIYYDTYEIIEEDLIDNNKESFSHSTQPKIGSYDICVFNNRIDTIKQITIWPRNGWYHRSNNLTLNLYHYTMQGATMNKVDWDASGVLFTYDIVHEDKDIPWEGKHEVINIPTLNEIIEPSVCNESFNTAFPFIHGEYYILLEVMEYNEKKNTKINAQFSLDTCEVTQCPINTYSDGGVCKRCDNDYMADVDSKSINDCKRCAYHRSMVSKDSSWCDIEECMEVVVTHNNGLGNKIDGIYYNLGKQYNNTVYISKSLKYGIIKSGSKYQIVNIQNGNNIIAKSNDSTELYPFEVGSSLWYEIKEDNPLHIMCPYKYAYSCDNLLNNECGNNELARYIYYKNSNLKWKCVNKEYLTDDYLNYETNYLKDSNQASDLTDSTVISIRDTCHKNYIVYSYDYHCAVNDNEQIITDMSSYKDLSGGDKIVCYINVYNSEGTKLLYYNLAWPVQLSAVDDSYTYYPIYGRVFVDNETSAISSSITIPKCSGNWEVSLSFDQTPIGGNSYTMFQNKAVNDDQNSDNSDALCLEIDCKEIIHLVNNSVRNLESKFFDHVNIPPEILLNCDVTYYPSKTSNNKTQLSISYIIFIVVIVALTLTIIGLLKKLYFDKRLKGYFRVNKIEV